MARDDEGAQDLPRSRLREIFRRATEIDQLTPTQIDLKELYEIAAEVGITPTALEQAIRETREREERRKRAAGKARRIRRILTGISSAVIAGAVKLTRIVVPTASPALVLNAVVPLALFSVGLAFYSRARGNRKTYQRDNMFVWGGFVVGWILVAATVPLDLLAPLLSWALTALIGHVIVGTGKPKPPTSADVELALDHLIGSGSPSESESGDHFGNSEMRTIQDWVIGRIIRSQLAAT
jgi:hypothetical protein